MSKDKCIICGSVRKKSEMIETSRGKAHSFHHGVPENKIQNEVQPNQDNKSAK